MKRKRCTQFTERETAQACAAWAATPANGPRGGTNWSAVADYYKRNFKQSTARTAQQLRNRFTNFYPLLMEWQKALEEATQMHTNDPSVDITTLAQHIFSGTEVGNPIPAYERIEHVMSCYEVVSGDRRWGALKKAKKKRIRKINTRVRKVNKKIRTSVVVDNEDDMTDFESDDDHNSSTISHSPRQTLVYNRRTSNNDDMVDYQHEATEEPMDLELRKLVAQEKMTAHQELTTEIQIMMHDCGSGSGSRERRDAYFTIMQNRILNKRKRE